MIPDRQHKPKMLYWAFTVLDGGFRSKGLAWPRICGICGAFFLSVASNIAKLPELLGK